MSHRRICVVTGTRADYGILYWLLREIADDPELTLQLVVTGMHLAPEFGSTFQAIEADGFAIDARVDMLLSSNTAVGVSKSVGLGVIGMADAFDALRPDVVVVLGDRFEILAAVQSAMLANIPIAHLHGGEVTEGAVDDGIRHAITKMAHLHFVAAEPYRARVIRMGESPDRVWTVGAPALDNIARLDLPSEAELLASVGLGREGPLFLITYHPVTRASAAPDAAVAELLAALDRFADARLLFTKANADAAGVHINSLLQDYVARRGHGAVLVSSLGQRRYLSAVRHAAVVIGNSSSGLVEAPALATPTVNIGDRQRGRLMAPSVVSVPESADAIAGGIRRALEPAFRRTLSADQSVYGAPGASHAVKEILKTVTLDGLVMKAFFDGPGPV